MPGQTPDRRTQVLRRSFYRTACLTLLIDSGLHGALQCFTSLRLCHQIRTHTTPLLHFDALILPKRNQIYRLIQEGRVERPVHFIGVSITQLPGLAQRICTGIARDTRDIGIYG